MMQTFPTRTCAARHAEKRNWRAFECQQIATGDEPEWTVEERDDGPGLEYAKLWSADKDYVHHIEMTLRHIPLIVCTCLIDEIDDAIPELFKLRPVTPSLWEPDSKKRRSANEPALVRSNIDPLAAARQLITPVAMSPEELARKFLSQK